MSVEMFKAGSCINKERMKSIGVCFGNFTKSGRFNLKITALDYLAQYANVCLAVVIFSTYFTYLF